MLPHSVSAAIVSNIPEHAEIQSLWLFPHNRNLHSDTECHGSPRQIVREYVCVPLTQGRFTITLRKDQAGGE